MSTAQTARACACPGARVQLPSPGPVYRFAGRYFNPEPPEHKSGMLTTQQRRYLTNFCLGPIFVTVNTQKCFMQNLYYAEKMQKFQTVTPKFSIYAHKSKN
jgi:hypothetical protein